MKKKLYWVGACALIITIVIAVVVQSQPTVDKDDAYKYQSRDKALVGGLAEITGDKQSTDEVRSWVIDKVADGNKEYCLIAVHYEEAGIQKHYSFVALVEKKAQKYAFFKVTADVALNSPGAVTDKENTDSLVFFFDDVEGYYICVGKVFLEGAVPYVNNQRLAMNQDGIFSYIDKIKRPEVFILQEGHTEDGFEAILIPKQ